MKTSSAPCASYRVPTGAEIKAFVECINLAVKVGHKVTYAQSGAEWVVSKVRVLEFSEVPTIQICTARGLFLPARDALWIERDSFAFQIAANGPVQRMEPSWMERAA